jgi:hypothetical protein
MNSLVCSYCETNFNSVKKTTKYCSQRCRSNDKRGVNVFVKTISQCAVCNGDYLKTRRDKITCNKSCASRLKLLKRNVNYKPRYESPLLLELYKEIVPYVQDWKKRQFFFTEADIFRVIDIHDKIHPNRYLSDSVKKELIYEQMVTEIILWCLANKKKLFAYDLPRLDL